MDFVDGPDNGARLKATGPLDNRGDCLPIKEVVCYTFAALQAWARERNVERQPEETPLEFAKRLGEEFPGLETKVRRFTTLYARAVYDYSPLPGNSLEVVKELWKRLETAAEQRCPHDLLAQSIRYRPFLEASLAGRSRHRNE
jgi:Domain of unknown function (DUF4129)